jgi:hypothetical protein
MGAEMNADRNIIRARAAYNRARANGASSMEASLAMIDAAFSCAAAFDDFKSRVRTIIEAGPCSPRIKARLEGRAVRLQNLPLSEAIIQVEGAWQRAVRGQQMGAYWTRPPRMELDILRECRLVLRYIRRHAAEQWPLLVRELLDPTPHSFFSTAAE